MQKHLILIAALALAGGASSILSAQQTAKPDLAPEILTPQSDSRPAMQIYDVRDLIPLETPSVPHVVIDTAPTNQGGGLFSVSPASSSTSNVQELIDTIQTVVAPDHWRDKGGQDASIRFYQGELYVFAPPDVQSQVNSFLQHQHALHNTQIEVDMRIVAVDQPTLDTFGHNTLLTQKEIAPLLDPRVATFATPRAVFMAGASARLSTLAHVTEDPTTQPTQTFSDSLDTFTRGGVFAFSAILAPDHQILLHIDLTFLLPAPPADANSRPTLEHHDIDTTISLPPDRYALLGGEPVTLPGAPKPVFLLYLLHAQALPAPTTKPTQ